MRRLRGGGTTDGFRVVGRNAGRPIPWHRARRPECGQYDELLQAVRLARMRLWSWMSSPANSRARIINPVRSFQLPKDGAPLLTVEEAQAAILSRVAELPPETVPFDVAAGRVLRED